jgi:ABC-type uncharacterized transport system substrate-binding protein
MAEVQKLKAFISYSLPRPCGGVVQVADPVAQGFVTSMRQPGGNVTGFSLFEFSLGGKWLDLLKEFALGLARIAFMFNPDTAPYSKFFIPVIETAAASLGVMVTIQRESVVGDATVMQLSCGTECADAAGSLSTRP